MLGVIDNAEFELELNRMEQDSCIIIPPNDIDVEVNEKVIDIKRGRGNVKEVPPAVRELIAVQKLNGASLDELREQFGLSKSSISAYSNGATSTATYNQPEPNLVKAISDGRSEIAGNARLKLTEAIAAITSDKLKGAKLRDISGVAKDMASVIKDMEGDNGPAIQQNILLYKPRMKNEDDYEVLVVNE